MVNDLIKKHNQVIQASYRLTPNEQAIILQAISQIPNNENITDQIMYTLKVEELARLTGTNHKEAYQCFKNAAKSLRKRELTLNNGYVLETGFVQSCKYHDGSGEISVRFNHDIVPYLSNLKDNFTSYNLRHVAKFKSTYAVRFYELVQQWRNTKNSLDISISDIKNMFQLESKYKRTDLLKRGVIDPALKDINMFSDIHLKYENIKNGRKITGFKFTWLSKNVAKHISSDYINKHARPGESYQQAYKRLLANKNK